MDICMSRGFCCFWGFIGLNLMQDFGKLFGIWREFDERKLANFMFKTRDFGKLSGRYWQTLRYIPPFLGV